MNIVTITDSTDLNLNGPPNKIKEIRIIFEEDKQNSYNPFPPCAIDEFFKRYPNDVCMMVCFCPRCSPQC